MKKLSTLLGLLLLAISPANAADSIPALKKSIEDPATGLNLQPGFAAELIYKVDAKKYGSWISMAFDKQGRLLVSDQLEQGVFRVTLPKIGENFSEKNIEKVNITTGVHGMLFAFGKW